MAEFLIPRHARRHPMLAAAIERELARRAPRVRTQRRPVRLA